MAWAATADCRLGQIVSRGWLDLASAGIASSSVQSSESPSDVRWVSGSADLLRGTHFQLGASLSATAGSGLPSRRPGPRRRSGVQLRLLMHPFQAGPCASSATTLGVNFGVPQLSWSRSASPLLAQGRDCPMEQCWGRAFASPSCPQSFSKSCGHAVHGVVESSLL